MSLLQMSFSGGILILVILILRGFFIHKLPKRTFLALWWVALLRLLLPVAVPSPLSAYSLVPAGLSAFETGETSGSAGIWAYLLPGAQIMVSGDSCPPADTGLAESGHGKGPNVQQGQSALPEEKIQPGQAFPAIPIIQNGSMGKEERSEPALSINVITSSSICTIIYLTGMILLAAFFAISCLRCRMEFRMSLPVKEPFFTAWLKAHPSKRTVSIRCSDKITAPLTYGILHPVILLPGKTAANNVTGGCLSGKTKPDNLASGHMAGKTEPGKTADIYLFEKTEAGNTAWDTPARKPDEDNAAQLEYVLLHEYIHICRLDAMAKLLIVLALCVHWFNPFAWAMYFLFNRDLELACDEQVVRRMGMDSRASYALTLISMEERKRALMPLCNGFGRNAIEERIKAIMKIKKTSLCAIGMAAMLVAGVTAAFATTAATVSAESRQFSAIPGTDYTEAEYRMLLALKFDGYEDMTISEYREKTFAITDTKSYMDLLERMEQDEQAGALKDENETVAFLYDCFFPLTAERWKVRSFGGCCDVKSESSSDRAVLEYSLNLIIWDKDTLKVGDYLAARTGISAELDRWMGERSEEELRDEEKMLALLDEEVESIYRRWDTDSLGINLETSFMPLTGYDTGIDASGNEAEDRQGSLAGYESELAEEEARLQAQAQEERLAQYAEILAPYLPFDLTYLYDKAADRIRMYYQGEEVRGLVDEEQGCWITESAGLDSYGEDAAELYAVYENGVLTGLRKATEQEQAEYTRLRRENSELRKRLDAEIQENFGGKAEAQGESGRAERQAASGSEAEAQEKLGKAERQAASGSEAEA